MMKLSCCGVFCFVLFCVRFTFVYMVLGGTARFAWRWCAGKRRSEEMRSNNVMLRSQQRFVHGNVDLSFGWLPVLGQDLQLGGGGGGSTRGRACSWALPWSQRYSLSVIGVFAFLRR